MTSPDTPPRTAPAMNLVVLDGYALNPGDLSWDGFHALGPCVIHDRSAPAKIVARARDAEIILTNKCTLRDDTFARLPRLRYIGVLATGHNVIDSAAARARGALILEFTSRVGHHARTVAEGRWTRNQDWCYWDQTLTELDGLTLGIVGWGRIGRAVADLGRAFGMHIIAHSRRDTPGAENVPLDELFRRSDVVSLHCPLTPETQGMVDARRLALMKTSALLVNTSRGPLIVDSDLAAALAAGKLAGAALDVLSAEPPPATHPLLTAPRTIITPHLAWATRAARSRLMNIAIENVRAFLAGQPQNVVN